MMDTSPTPAPSGGVPFWLRAVVILLVLAGAVLTAFFGVRVLRGVVLLHEARRHPAPMTDVGLMRSWMTLPYLARAYRVPESALWQAAGIPEDGNRRKSLRVLAREYGQPDLIQTLQAAIRAYRAAHPSAPAPTRPPGAGPAEWHFEV